MVFDENLIEIISAHAEESIDSDSLESRRNALQTCLETLPSNDRQLIKIRYTNHMTINAYAESKNLNPASLRGSLRNIRKALAKCVRFRLAQENFA